MVSRDHGLPGFGLRARGAASGALIVPIVPARRGKRGLPDIFVPRAIVHVPEVPVLGTGKIDYVNVGQLAAGLERAS